MSQIGVHRVTNANIYANGASLLGKAAEVQLPQLKTIMSEHNALGLYGKFKLPSGLDAMEATIKLNSFYADVLALSVDPFGVVELQVRCSIEQYGAQGRTGELPGVIFMRGTFMDPNLGSFKQHDNVETDVKFNVLSVRFEIDRVAVLNVDVLANVYEVQGVDKLNNYRRNIGG